MEYHTETIFIEKCIILQQNIQCFKPNIHLYQTTHRGKIPCPRVFIYRQNSILSRTMSFYCSLILGLKSAHESPL